MATSVSENGINETGEKVGTNKSSKMVYVVFISLIIDLLAFTMILPLLPSLLDYYGHHDEGGLYHVLLQYVHSLRSLIGAPDTPRWNSVLFGGLIGSLFSLLQFLASPMIGAASDYYGRKPLMLLNLIGIAVSYAIWAVSTNFTIFVLARIVGGISKGNISLSTAIVTDISTPQTRGKGMALIGIAFSVGFLIGPLIGAYFAKQVREHEGMFFVAPALFALTLAVINVVFVYACFKETLPQEKRAHSVGSKLQEAYDLIQPVSLFKFSAVHHAKKSDLDQMQRIGLVYFLYLFLYSGLEFTLTFLTHNRFQYDSMKQGKMFFFIGIIMSIVQGGYVRRIKPGKEKKVALMGIGLVIPSFLVIGLASTTTVMYCGLALFSFASATVVPCLTTLMSSYGQDDQKGTVMGIFRSLGALARALGPMAASIVYWSLGSTACYSIGGVLLVAPLLILRKLDLKKNTE
ncbi:major facilitator superfamily domain-containing protein 10 [Lingula anatina]|uniref:Major facilitator superfamily domain-containing protein 10 n=1 Tax=Lingula anatina TaxID=7574 RepID=A0A1S3IDZ8_LINAN|nr:major facilitator superfamily domain-containing protein 10 [Lingula anatina]|eukprot:XP_013396076.1 major facilitator superfamily domain-containing protein 10 [Lingula anatina]